ncbi:hypothetical protein [Nannocystis bainbridge]|uniref:Uncharacterized protein n=1 Tax=Nannocystis bainbridge TaxID=2995303 RepID=A0ABT5DRZ3_9BACT|nr:hypothetical protein [Nannocystis bainbridge]MDC0716400.1 hypothetical protein [Nannocystis bainbridge]
MFDDPAPAKSAAERCADDEKSELQPRRFKLRFGLALGSTSAFLISSLTFVFARKPLETQSQTGFAHESGVDGVNLRVNCMKGKPCGNSCISWDKECHVDDSDGVGSLGKLTPAGWVVGTTFFVIGVGLLVAAFVAPPRLKPRRAQCGLSGCSLKFQF